MCDGAAAAAAGVLLKEGTGSFGGTHFWYSNFGYNVGQRSCIHTYEVCLSTAADVLFLLLNFSVLPYFARRAN